MLCHISVCYGLWNYLKRVRRDNKVKSQLVYTSCVVIPCSSDYYATRCRYIYDLVASRKYSKRDGNQHMKEWAEHYRLARQRTVRIETTKDKAGALPPAVYQRAKTGTWRELSFPDSYAKSSTASVSNESVILSTTSDCTVVTFVSDEKTTQVLIATDP